MALEGSGRSNHIAVMRYRALVEYDGTNYFGFQRQRDQPTVQEALEQSISKVTGASVGINFSGRTDTGVHAVGQVIAFNVDWAHTSEALCKAINANLPLDIAIREADTVEDKFHPRFDAKRRQYRYYIHNASVRSPSERLYSWHVKRDLELNRMNDAVRIILGEHDFATFGQAPQGNNTVRTIYAAKWQQRDKSITFNIEANAFLYRMVRSIVGTMKQIGEGSWTLEQFGEALASKDRSQSGQSAPPHGLFLVSVKY